MRRLVLASLALGVLLGTLPAAALAPGEFTTYPLPVDPQIAAKEPRGIAYGADGNLWFADYAGDAISRLTPAGVFTRFPLAARPSPARPRDIVAAPDGTLWFTADDTVGAIDSTGVITEHTVAEGAMYLVAGPDDALWFTGSDAQQILRMTYDGAVTAVLTPAIGTIRELEFESPTVLWFAQSAGERVGRFDLESGQVEFIPIRFEFAAEALAIAPDGTVWVSSSSGSEMARITSDRTVRIFPIPTRATHANDMEIGPDGQVWFVESGGAKLGRISASGQITEYPLPSPDSDSRHLSRGPDNTLWITDHRLDSIIRFEVPSIARTYLPFVSR
ncbi:MAG TPA: hypothetical protein VD886_12580 [Herpetosiphonaceae bacterium]|nr:hypothetical protein [Herpetosiphonaceae bacterium]